MRPQLSRLATAVTAAVLATVAAVATAPAPAAAAKAGGFTGEIPCPTDPFIRWNKDLVLVHIGYQYSNIRATATFFASDGRTVENTLEQTVSATFTAAQTRTTTVTVSVGTALQLTEQLKYTVDTKIEITRSTAIGVDATVDVPPRTRTTGLYGIHGYMVNYDALKIFKLGKKCYTNGGVPAPAITSAPTFVEGWQFSSAAI